MFTSLLSVSMSTSMSMSKAFIGGAVCRRVQIGSAGGRRNVRPCMSYAAQNSSVITCALKVVMVAELFVTGDREFQTADAMMLNILDWKWTFAAGNITSYRIVSSRFAIVRPSFDVTFE